jgi:hypothetical protein
MKQQYLSWLAGLLLIIPNVMTPPLQAAGYGHFTGQVVVEGTPKPRKLEVKKGDPAIRDLCCKEHDIPDQKLVINPKNKGLANCFVYLKKCDTSEIHPDLKVSKVTEVVQLQKHCTFVPHCLIVRTDQHLVIKSDDPAAHNLNYKPRYNSGDGFVLPPNPREGYRLPRFTACERYPTGVECNIHPWMSAQWLIIDHPYAAITDQDGHFKIRNLPAGRHEFIIHHQLAGMVHYPEQKTIEVVISNGSTSDLGVLKVKASKFDE